MGLFKSCHWNSLLKDPIESCPCICLERITPWKRLLFPFLVDMLKLDLPNHGQKWVRLLRTIQCSNKSEKWNEQEKHLVFGLKKKIYTTKY